MTEVKLGTTTIGNFHRLRPVQFGGSVRFGSVRLPFLPPTNFGTERKIALTGVQSKGILRKRANLILLTLCFLLKLTFWI